MFKLFKKAEDSKALRECDELKSKLTRAEGVIHDLNLEAADKEKELDKLAKERRKLKEEVEDLKLKKKIEQEDIEHMVKIKLEKAEVATERAVMKAEKEKQDAIHDVKVKCNDDIQKLLEGQIKDIKDLNTQILERFNVGVATGYKE